MKKLFCSLTAALIGFAFLSAAVLPAQATVFHFSEEVVKTGAPLEDGGMIAGQTTYAEKCAVYPCYDVWMPDHLCLYAELTLPATETRGTYVMVTPLDMGSLPVLGDEDFTTRMKMTAEVLYGEQADYVHVPYYYNMLTYHVVEPQMPVDADALTDYMQQKMPEGTLLRFTVDDDDNADTPDRIVYAVLPAQDLSLEACFAQAVDIYKDTGLYGILPSSQAAEQPQISQLLFGDVNADAMVDVSDAVLLAKAVSDTVTLSEAQADAANVRLDDELNQNDLIVLMQYLVQNVKSLPVCE